MTEYQTTSTPTRVLSAPEYRQMLDGYDALLAGTRDANKAALFAGLAGAGVTQVIVTFDGCGDSGQIESVEVKTSDGPVDLPDTTVRARVAESASRTPARVTCWLPS